MSDPDQLVEEFFTISKFPHGPLAEAFLGRCRSRTIKANGTFYKYFQRGEGPAVLLVHGVHSNLAAMVGIAADLLDEGYRVVLFDAPGHGEALGTTTDPVEVAALITAVARKFPDLHAIVGHSLGGLWSLATWQDGIRPRAVVCLSTPSTMTFLVDKFAELNALDGAGVETIVRGVEARLGADVWRRLSPVETVASVDVPALIVHGAEDDFVPPEHAERLHAAWPGSTLEIVADAGHFDVLKEAGVRKLVTQFVADVLGEPGGATATLAAGDPEE